jgi:hypothetical protein
VTVRDDERNTILAAYLRAPSNSPRTLAEVAMELFGLADSGHRQDLIAEVSSAMDQVTPYVLSERGYKGDWDRRRAKAADEWMALRWPWMTKKNRRAVVSRVRWELLW